MSIGGAMLQDIRDNAQSTVAKVIVGLIVLTFALFGVDSIVGGFGGEPEVATVNGNEITELEFLRAVDIKKRQILNQMGENADPALIDEQLLKQSVLEGLIDQEVLLQDAEENGIYVSEQSIDSLITNIGQFQIDGKFDNSIFLAAIRNIGMTTQTYKNLVKKEVLIAQPRNAIVSSSFLLGDEFNRVMEIDRQTRNYSLLKFEKSQYIENVSVTDDEVSIYYEDNRDEFKTLESVDVEYILLDKDSLLEQVSVDEQALQSLYEREISTFEDSEERNASHILIEVNDEMTESQAKAKIDEIKSLLDQGRSFEVLAKEFSHDIGSAEQGGSLGFATKGTYAPEFDESLFSLSEGEVSNPVLTEYGYHLIKLVDIQKQPVPSFEEMRIALEAEAKAQKVESLYVELSEKLADSSYASSDLAEPAEELGLKIQTESKVSKQTDNELLQNPRVQKALFSTEVLKDGNNSELIEISSESAIVVRISQHYPESQKSLELVRSDIIERLKNRKASEKAVSEGEAVMASLTSAEDESGKADLNWESFTGIKRNDFEKNPALLKSVFSMPKEKGDGLILKGVEISGDYYLVKLDSINVEGVDSIDEQERKAIENMVGGGLGNAEYQVYQNSLKAQADIEKI